MVATKLQLPQSMHMRQCPYTSPAWPCTAALGVFANALTGLYVSDPATAEAAARAAVPLTKPRLDRFIVLIFTSFSSLPVGCGS